MLSLMGLLSNETSRRFFASVASMTCVSRRKSPTGEFSLFWFPVAVGGSCFFWRALALAVALAKRCRLGFRCWRSRDDVAGRRTVALAVAVLRRRCGCTEGNPCDTAVRRDSITTTLFAVLVILIFIPLQWWNDFKLYALYLIEWTMLLKIQIVILAGFAPKSALHCTNTSSSRIGSTINSRISALLLLYKVKHIPFHQL